VKTKNAPKGVCCSVFPALSGVTPLVSPAEYSAGEGRRNLSQ